MSYLKGGDIVAEKIKLVGNLIKLYLQKGITMLQIMLIHFEEIVAHTEQEVAELSEQLKEVLTIKESIQNMIEELKTGRFKAILDVFWKEPHPYVEGELYDLDNVIIIPHKGGPTVDRYPWSANDIMDEVYEYLVENKPLRSEIPKERGLSMTTSIKK